MPTVTEKISQFFPTFKIRYLTVSHSGKYCKIDGAFTSVFESGVVNEEATGFEISAFGGSSLCRGVSVYLRGGVCSTGTLVISLGSDSCGIGKPVNSSGSDSFGSGIRGSFVKLGGGALRRDISSSMSSYSDESSFISAASRDNESFNRNSVQFGE